MQKILFFLPKMLIFLSKILIFKFDKNIVIQFTSIDCKCSRLILQKRLIFFNLGVLGLNAKTDRRTPETVVKCKFSGSSRNPLVTSCSSDVQNCGEMQISELDGQPFRHFVLVGRPKLW